MKAFPLRSGTTQGCPLLTILFNIVLEILATAIRQEKEIKYILIGREETKLSLLAYNLTLYMENPKTPPKNNNKFCKLMRHKINIQKSVAFFTLTTNHVKEKLRKTIPFTIA